MIGYGPTQPDSGVYWFYARRSSEKQDKSLDEQFAEFHKRFHAPEGATLMPPVGDTISATKKKIDDRVEFSKLMMKLQPGDHLVVWRIDRLGRTFLEMVQTADKIAQKQVWLHSLCESGGKELNLSSMEARTFLYVLMIGHSMYVHYMKEAVMRNTRYKKAAGMAHTALPKRGHKRIIRGYRPNGNPIYVDVWDQKELVRYRTVYEMRNQGMNWHQIAEWVYKQVPAWIVRYGKTKQAPWVKRRPGVDIHQLRVEKLIKADRLYRKWLRDKELPGMENDTDKLTYGYRPDDPSVQAVSFEDLEVHLEDQVDPDATPQ